MDVLKELLDNARKLLGQMSSTQRASIVTMVITVAALLTLIVWLGSISEKKTDVPLDGIRVELKDSSTYIKMLEDNGIKGARYDDKNMLLLVPPEQKQQALAILAQNNAIPESHGGGFEKALADHIFTDSGPITDKRLVVALQNEVARMIEAIDGVERADVIYTDDISKQLFRTPFRKRATIKVTMKMGKDLKQQTADAIIRLATFARSGLDEKDVVVTDQKGRSFHKDEEDSLNQVAAKAMELNRKTSEEAQRSIEECVRRIIPNSEVYAWVDTKWNMDKKTKHTKEITQGQPGNTSSRKIKDDATQKTGTPVGTGPNVIRASNMANSTTNETARHYERSEKDVRMENGYEETNQIIAPTINSQTISVVVHLPPKQVLDKDGKPVFELDKDGKPVLDPKTNQPKRKQVTTPELKGAELTALERSVRKVAGQLDGAQNMEVEIAQVAWTPDFSDGQAQEEPDSFKKLLSENVASIFMMIILLVALFFVYRLAKRSIPAEEVELPEAGDFGGLFTPAHLTDEDRAQADFEQMRDQVGEFIDEDPAKAASIVRRWMVTREGY